MKRIAPYLWQAALIALIGAVAGFSVNQASETPLALAPTPTPPPEESWPVMDAAEVWDHVQNGTAIVIDARDPNEYEAGRVPGSVNLPESEFQTYFEEIGQGLPRAEVPLVVYCQGGLCDQSHIVLENLSELQFESLYLFQGGWEAWVERGFPTEP